MYLWSKSQLMHCRWSQRFHELDADIPRGAVKVPIKLLKNSKASGADGIPAEVLKGGGEALAAVLHAVCKLCWRFHCLPQDFKDATITTLYQNERKSAGLQQLSRNFAAWYYWENLIPHASSKAASHRRQGSAGESMWFPYIVLNHWRGVHIKTTSAKWIEQ